MFSIRERDSDNFRKRETAWDCGGVYNTQCVGIIMERVVNGATGPGGRRRIREVIAISHGK